MPVIAWVVCSMLSRTCPNTSCMFWEESMNRRSEPWTVDFSSAARSDRPVCAAHEPVNFRYAAICGSAAEIGVHPWAITIFPFSGVTV